MSLLFREANTLFLHIPRTGGTWIEEALKSTPIDINVGKWRKQLKRPLPVKHCLLWHHPHNCRVQIEQVMTFVRHPITYYESVWSYFADRGSRSRKALANRYEWHPFQEPARLWSPDFNEWVLKMLHHHPGWMSRLVEQYIGPIGGEFVQWIGRTEWLKSHFCEIMSEIGCHDQIKKNEHHLRKLEKVHTSKKKKSVRWGVGVEDMVLSSERRFVDRFYKDITRIRYAEETP